MELTIDQREKKYYRAISDFQVSTQRENESFGRAQPVQSCHATTQVLQPSISAEWNRSRISEERKKKTVFSTKVIF
jgi:hypothetical protein